MTVNIKLSNNALCFTLIIKKEASDAQIELNQLFTRKLIFLIMQIFMELAIVKIFFMIFERCIVIGVRK